MIEFKILFQFFDKSVWQNWKYLIGFGFAGEGVTIFGNGFRECLRQIIGVF